MSIPFRAALRRVTPPSSIASYVGRAIAFAPLLAAASACASVLGIDEPNLRLDEETRGEEGGAGASCSSSTAPGACGESVTDNVRCGEFARQASAPGARRAGRGRRRAARRDEWRG